MQPHSHGEAPYTGVGRGADVLISVVSVTGGEVEGHDDSEQEADSTRDPCRRSSL